jgi:hypothetical protein
MDEWLSFAARWSLVPLATIAIYEGMRRLSWSRSGRNGAALVLFGIAVLGTDAASLTFSASNIESMIAVLDQKALPPVQADVLAQMTPAEREEKTRILAQIAFDRAGALVEYVNAAGQKVRYAPTEKEIRDRETLTVSVAQAQVRMGLLRAQAWMFVLAVVVAAGAGAYARFFGGAPRAENK